MNAPWDVIIAGAGIVGAACAARLSDDGLRVCIIDPGPIGCGGATAAGMGHIMVTDDSPALFDLTRLSRELWDRLAPSLPADCERVQCGTLWVAEDDAEMSLAEAKVRFYRDHAERAELLTAADLQRCEPNLRPGLRGGFRLPEDSILYPPCVVRVLLQRVIDKGGEVILGTRVNTLRDGVATLADGRHLEGHRLVNALGVWAAELSAGVPVRRRKGHLLITDRYPGFCAHEIVELGYLKAAHGHADEAVAFNLQMRPTGQLLLGSTRQFVDSPDVEHRIVSRLVARGVHFMPGLEHMNVLRVWTGFRAATPDSLPFIGPHPDDETLLLATGHEGLGVTTAMGTAELIAAWIAGDGRRPAIDPSPFMPTRSRLGLPAAGAADTVLHGGAL